MDNERNNRDKEYDIEDHVGTRYLRYYRISGEDDRHCSAQTYPGNEESRTVCNLLTERQQAEEDTERTTNNNHKYTDKRCYQSDIE